MARAFALVGLAIIGSILAIKALLDAPIRLQVYVVEVGIVLVLGFFVLERARTEQTKSRAEVTDLVLAGGLAAGLIAWNLSWWANPEFRTSPEPGFADAIALICIAFIGIYGRKNVRLFLAPLSLLVLLAGITFFISNEDPTFYAWIGRHFVAATVMMSSELLRIAGFAVTSGADSFRVLGTPSLTVQVGIRCGGMDVSTTYALLIGFFAWKTNLRGQTRVVIALIGAVGAFLLNGLRVAFLTVLFLNYPADLVDAVHTNLGDLIFAGYAVGFIIVLRKHLRLGP